MKLTEAKLKQMILDEMKSNLSLADQDELNADIELVRKILQNLMKLGEKKMKSMQAVKLSGCRITTIESRLKQRGIV
mgnify:CR=1 FL=1